MKRYDGKAALAFQLRAMPLAPFVTEYGFHPTRRWRFDLAWVAQKFACEVDGGLYVYGGHTRGKGREDDMEKDAEAMCLGWRVLRVSTGHVRSGAALHWIERCLGATI